jgi:hypothetical protein
MSDEVKLLDCPFCGGPGSADATIAGRVRVGCDFKNLCHFRPALSGDVAKCIAIWNRRAPTRQPVREGGPEKDGGVDGLDDNADFGLMDACNPASDYGPLEPVVAYGRALSAVRAAWTEDRRAPVAPQAAEEWKRGRTDMRSYLAHSGVEVHYLYPPHDGERIPILGSTADCIDPQVITAKLVEALNARAQPAAGEADYEHMAHEATCAVLRCVHGLVDGHHVTPAPETVQAALRALRRAAQPERRRAVRTVEPWMLDAAREMASLGVAPGRDSDACVAGFIAKHAPAPAAPCCEAARALEALEYLIQVSLPGDAVVGRKSDGTYRAAANFALTPASAEGPTLLAAITNAATPRAAGTKEG